MSGYDWTIVGNNVRGNATAGISVVGSNNVEAPDARKVTTITRWAVLPGDMERSEAVHRAYYSRRDVAELSGKRTGATNNCRYRVVRLDITISEEGDPEAQS